MTIHKISLNDFECDDFILIAIHSVLDDYRLAYQLNKNLGVLFEKNNNSIPFQIKNNKVYFTRFTFETTENESIWELIQNQVKTEEKTNAFENNLFETETFTQKAILIQELKKADYLLKIEENNQINTEKIVKKINKIEGVSTSFTVDISKIKSIQNLIF